MTTLRKRLNEKNIKVALDILKTHDKAMHCYVPDGRHSPDAHPLC